MMLSQRVRGAESRIKNKSSNGPPRAQSKGTANGRSSHSFILHEDREYWKWKL